LLQISCMQSDSVSIRRANHYAPVETHCMRTLTIF
jgi:hypothetical protein